MKEILVKEANPQPAQIPCNFRSVDFLLEPKNLHV